MSVTLQPPPPPPAPVPAGWEGLLDQGETILWQGAPDTGVEFSVSQLPEVLFGLAFTGFSLFWMIMASRAGGFFWMFGLVFFLIGLGTVTKNNALAAFRRRYSYYTLTNRRAIIATSVPFLARKLKSYPISASTLLDIEENGDFGTISFRRSEWRDNNRGRKSGGFERISEPRRVFSLMRQIQQEAK